ncbi:MAG: hypothetical protein MI920_35210, partial [Kiloniellales bacterium]|nr:hypothetical protein [Kiloniellales bacterium]
MSEPSQSQPSSTDVKDEVLHLRTVHFSLLVACVALYGLTFASQTDEYDKAQRQLAALQDMIAGWSPTWLEASAAAAVAEQAPVIDTAIAPAADCWPCR